jgi:hypothetical protein
MNVVRLFIVRMSEVLSLRLRRGIEGKVVVRRIVDALAVAASSLNLFQSRWHCVLLLW